MDRRRPPRPRRGEGRAPPLPRSRAKAGVRLPRLSRATRIAGTIAIVAGLVIGVYRLATRLGRYGDHRCPARARGGPRHDPRSWRWLLWTAIVGGPLVLLEVASS